ncbi:RpoL/Rpb11 RNA polymerase subunit family protein [Geoglobus acetivorans]|uniref:DNA-directed RNA polymerase subunit Rpo11 n=1 Tax=Geoglobus acetivorans TaxID=565033 RepID=A0A0A7GHK3_GEOAI|nr:DNA-directed RNA polymerase subunit L [Geoglobus acetivorans]
MEVKIVELAENYVRLMVKGEDHTFLNLLQHELVNDDGVVLAKYNITHPLRDEAELMIRTSGKDPLEVLKEANQRIISKIDEVLSQL